jgi:hypothetical protein
MSRTHPAAQYSTGNVIILKVLIRSKKKNKFFESNQNVGEDSKVSTFPDLSKNSQLCGNELDKRISTLSSTKEEENHEEAIDYCLRVASRTLALKSLFEKLSGVGQGSSLISSQNDMICSWRCT